MRLPESRLGATGRGEIVFVRVVEGSQRGFRRLGELVDERLHHHRHRLDRCPLLKTTVVVPPHARRGAFEPDASEEQRLHPPGHQHSSQGLENVLLQDSHAAADPRHNLVKLVRPNEVVGPLGEELIDRGVAHHDPIRLSLLREEKCVDDVLFIVGEPHPRRILAGRRHRLDEELIHHLPHDDGPLEAAFAETAPRPGDHQRVGAAGPCAHLQNRGQHEKSKHRHDRETGQGGLLVLAKDSERAGHSTAYKLFARRRNRRGLTRKERGG